MSYPFENDGELVCHCMGVEAYEIRKAIWDGDLATVQEVSEHTRACTGCQSCYGRIEEIIEETLALKDQQK